MIKKSTVSVKVSDLINPPLISDNQHYMNEFNEGIYASHKLAPLGKCPSPQIPYYARSWTFGRVTEKGDAAGDLISPINSSDLAGIHGDSPNNTCGVLKYKPFDNPNTRPAGTTQEFDNSGKRIMEIMKSEELTRDKLIPVELDDFREKNQHCVGAVLEREKYKESQKSKIRDSVLMEKKAHKEERKLLEQIWNTLKRKNHESFDDWASAFQYYDKNKTGKISATDLHQMCCTFGIAVSFDLVKKLLYMCDIIDNDGKVSYLEFIHCLNWKYLLPGRTDCTNRKAEQHHTDWTQGINDPSKEMLDKYRTEASLYTKPYDTSSIKTAGIPSIRVDKAYPNKKSVADYANYGETGSVASLLQRNVFTDHGVYEEDLFAPRSKEEMMLLVTVKITGEL